MQASSESCIFMRMRFVVLLVLAGGCAVAPAPPVAQATAPPVAPPIARPEPSTARVLTGSIRSYFASQNWLVAAPATVMAYARGIVQRFDDDEPSVMKHVDEEIESHKRTDANWTWANRLAEGRELVLWLGLSPKTKQRNRVFLEMRLPEVVPPEEPSKRCTP